MDEIQHDLHHVGTALPVPQVRTARATLEALTTEFADTTSGSRHPQVEATITCLRGAHAALTRALAAAHLVDHELDEYLKQIGLRPLSQRGRRLRDRQPGSEGSATGDRMASPAAPATADEDGAPSTPSVVKWGEEHGPLGDGFRAGTVDPLGLFAAKERRTADRLAADGRCVHPRRRDDTVTRKTNPDAMIRVQPGRSGHDHGVQ